MNGMEMLLKQMGLGEAMQGMKQLIDSGAIQKIMDFADNAHAIGNELVALRDEVADLKRMLSDGRTVEARPRPALIDGTVERIGDYQAGFGNAAL